MGRGGLNLKKHTEENYRWLTPPASLREEKKNAGPCASFCPRAHVKGARAGVEIRGKETREMYFLLDMYVCVYIFFNLSVFHVCRGFTALYHWYGMCF